ncbi:MAG TPA: MFS transporter [Alphaproteobacteria bacterium]|nr:MFS transporter [Alphaproteobacteria bacterium]
MALAALSGWTKQQKLVVVAAFLGWSLDAFDFFLMVFVLKDIAQDFGTDVEAVSYALFLTLASRPVGAFIFGRAADRWGRRPVLMVNILLYSMLGFASGFSSSLTMLLVLRTLFGVAMGGEWGVGSSLAMESIPVGARGVVSGLLQAGYPSGYLIASLAFWFLFPIIGWRGMLMLGALPALLVVYIRSFVPESPVWTAHADTPHEPTLTTVAKHWKLALYLVVLMTAFNFFSHGSQDLYPTFLRVQLKFDSATVGTIAVVYNIGAICGGIFFGNLSERIGRRRAIVIASLLALPVLPLWALSTDPVLLGLGAFLMQICVQGAWGVIPAHLNELSPPRARGTFPGFVYQLGNLIASYNATLQSGIAERHGNDYSMPLLLVVGVVAVVIAVITGFGLEARGVSFHKQASPARAT